MRFGTGVKVLPDIQCDACGRGDVHARSAHRWASGRDRTGTGYGGADRYGNELSEKVERFCGCSTTTSDALPALTFDDGGTGEGAQLCGALAMRPSVDVQPVTG